jgi:hypothetical protein
MRQRLGVPVEPDQAYSGMALEHCFGVPAETQRGVDVVSTVTVERGSQEFEAALQQYRYVRTARLLHIDPLVWLLGSAYRQIPIRFSHSGER